MELKFGSLRKVVSQYEQCHSQEPQANGNAQETTSTFQLPSTVRYWQSLKSHGGSWQSWYVVCRVPVSASQSRGQNRTGAQRQLNKWHKHQLLQFDVIRTKGLKTDVVTAWPHSFKSNQIFKRKSSTTVRSLAL